MGRSVFHIMSQNTSKIRGKHALCSVFTRPFCFHLLAGTVFWNLCLKSSQNQMLRDHLFGPEIRPMITQEDPSSIDNLPNVGNVTLFLV